MKVKQLLCRQEASGPIARERLRLMAESAPFENSPDAAKRMKKEISEIISRYFEIAPDNYEIRVVLKQNKEKSMKC